MSNKKLKTKVARLEKERAKLEKQAQKVNAAEKDVALEACPYNVNQYLRRFLYGEAQQHARVVGIEYVDAEPYYECMAVNNSVTTVFRIVEGVGWEPVETEPPF